MSFTRKGASKNSKSSSAAWPDCSGYRVSSRALRVKILSGHLADTVKGGCTGTIGVWSDARNGWAVPPMVLTMMVDNTTFHYPELLSFILGDDLDPANEALFLKIEITEKKMLRTHKVAQIQMPFSQFVTTEGSDQDIISGSDYLGSAVTGTMTKPESKKNPTNRGTIACQVKLLPLTYALDVEVFFKELPHNINHWIVLLYSEDDKVRSAPAKDSSEKTAGRSGLDRFRACAVRLQAMHSCVQFGEAPLELVEKIRKGSRAALRITYGSEFGRPPGQIVAMNGNQSLTFSSTEAYEYRLRSFINQFRSSSTSGAWNRAVEVLGQLNPSVMVDLDLDTQDFGSLGSLSTLFRTVGETLVCIALCTHTHTHTHTYIHTHTHTHTHTHSCTAIARLEFNACKSSLSKLHKPCARSPCTCPSTCWCANWMVSSMTRLALTARALLCGINQRC